MEKTSVVKSLIRVHFTKRNTGMGFVVEDGSGTRYVITAAHCVRHHCRYLARGAGNTDLLVGVSSFCSSAAPLLMACAVSWEPCADIAVLGLETLSGAISPDWQALNEFLEAHTPAPVRLDVGSIGRKRFRVRVCQHTGEWISGIADGAWVYGKTPSIIGVRVPKSQPILGGTSGSPVFDDAGRVIGVISTTPELDGKPTGEALLSCLAGALPGWMLDNLSQGA